MFMDGVVDNMAAKQEIDFFSPKTWKRADMTVYRAVGSGCEIGSVAGKLLFLCEKSMLQQWVILVKNGLASFCFCAIRRCTSTYWPRGLSCRSKGGHETPAEATRRSLTPLPPHPPSAKIGDEEEKVC